MSYAHARIVIIAACLGLCDWIIAWLAPVSKLFYRVDDKENPSISALLNQMVHAPRNDRNYMIIPHLAFASNPRSVPSQSVVRGRLTWYSMQIVYQTSKEIIKLTPYLLLAHNFVRTERRKGESWLIVPGFTFYPCSRKRFRSIDPVGKSVPFRSACNPVP